MTASMQAHMPGLGAHLTAGPIDWPEEIADANALLDKAHELSGPELSRLAEEVLGADTIADLMVANMADWDAGKIRAACKRAGVRL